MLTPSTIVATPSQTSLANPRQIAVTSASSSIVLYTVPAGKKFVGYIYGQGVASDYAVTPSGGTAISQSAPATTTTTPITPFQSVLVAGAIITTQSSSRIYVVGVESDL